MSRSLVAAAATVALVLLPARARAHAIGLSTGEYTAKDGAVHARLAFARSEVAALLPGLDVDRDGHVTALEIDAAKRELEAKVMSRIAVSVGGAECSPVLTSAGLTEQDGLTIDGRFDCGSNDKPFEVTVKLLDDLARGHRHIARGIGAVTQDEVLYEGHASFTIASPAASTVPPTLPASATTTSAWTFFKMGVAHILTGYDHLVFLIALVLLRARVGQLVGVVTAFTVAHSITLAVAGVGIFTPSARFVEPAIALSIAYVGIENFFVKDGSKRWRITFPFGLIHGFGFAGALREVSVSRAQLPGALVSFNLGVEAGQLFVLGLVLPMIILVRQQEWFEPKGVRVLSGAVAIAGGIWFVSRLAAG